MLVCRLKIRCDRIRFAVQHPFQNAGDTHKDGLRRSFMLGPFCGIHVGIIGIATFKVGFPKHAETDKSAQSQKVEHLTQAGGIGAVSFFCQNLAIALDNSAKILIRVALIVSDRKIRTVYTPFGHGTVTPQVFNHLRHRLYYAGQMLRLP